MCSQGHDNCIRLSRLILDRHNLERCVSCENKFCDGTIDYICFWRRKKFCFAKANCCCLKEWPCLARGNGFTPSLGTCNDRHLVWWGGAFVTLSRVLRTDGLVRKTILWFSNDIVWFPNKLTVFHQNLVSFEIALSQDTGIVRISRLRNQVLQTLNFHIWCYLWMFDPKRSRYDHIDSGSFIQRSRRDISIG